MPSSDPLSDLTMKINDVIARLEQALSQAEREPLGKALDGYMAARDNLVAGKSDDAAQAVKAADENLAKAKAAPAAPVPAAGGGAASGGGDALALMPAPAPAAGPPTRADLSTVAPAAGSSGRPLSANGLQSACQQLGVSAPEIWAVVFTECDPPYSGYFPDGRPQILFERHIFHRLTGGRFDADNPDISNTSPGGYGPSGSHQYDRLRRAMALDQSAAIESASWGMGQTLGSNFRTLGYASPQELMRQMFQSEDQQLLGLVAEIKTSRIAGALAAHDWPNFARVYNGPNFAINHYDQHLSSWYAKFASGALPDLHVRAAQMYLMFLKLDPAEVDGMWGKRTLSALNQFQAIKGLPRTDSLDDASFTALAAAGEAAAAPDV